MNILFVVENRNTPNYLCVCKVAEACQQRGHNVYVLSQGYEKEKISSLNNIVKEYSIEPDFATNIHNLFARIKLKSIGRFIYKLIFFLFTPIWPIRAPFYIVRLTKRVNYIIKNEKIDVVVLVHVSIENLLVAKKKLDNVVYVGYFLDLLVGGMKPSYMSEKMWKQKVQKAEKIVMELLDYGIMMKSAQNLYKDLASNSYLKKITFLDLPMLSKLMGDSNSERRQFFSKDDIVLLFTGSMANNVRDPHYILELVSRIRNANIRFVIVGNSDYCDVINKYTLKDARIIFMGRKTHEESMKMMKEADFFVNIGNNFENMIPSKIFEYMSYKKPIISTFRIDNDPCLEPLVKYGLFIAIDERIDEDINAEKLENFIDKNRKARIDDARFRKLTNRDGDFYNNTCEAFADFIDQLM